MFGIVRFEKYGKADLYGIEKEANRSEKARSEGLELPGTFCDWDRTGQNYYFDKTDKWVRHIDARLKAENITRIRKDAVYGLGVFCGASPEFFEGKTREEALKFFADMRQEVIDVICQGDASRLINFVVHFDEKTHLPVILQNDSLQNATKQKANERYRIQQNILIETINRLLMSKSGQKIHFECRKKSVNKKLSIIQMKSYPMICLYIQI